MPKEIDTAGLLIASAFALGESLGLDKRVMALAALHGAFNVAEASGDPDGYLATLTDLAQARRRKGK